MIVEPEAHYNHYGTRGVADLFVRSIESGENGDYVSDALYEVKSASAVQQATGANEIIRQFNKMRKTFYLDESRDEPDEFHIELTFTIEPETVQHVARNFEMYAGANANPLYVDPDHRWDTEKVMFRSAKDGVNQPIQLMNGDSERASSLTGWIEYLEKMEGPTEAATDRILEYIHER